MKKRLSMLVGAVLALQTIFSGLSLPATAAGIGEEYTEPESPSVTYNMNVDWKYKRANDSQVFPLATAMEGVAKNGVDFYEVGYDDSDWEDVSVPHPMNADNSFIELGVDAGDPGVWRGFMFYRKNITIPESDAGKKLLLEFEAVRQSVYLWVNGEMVGYYEAGVAPIGFDITNYVNVGEENLIAIATDNAASRGSSFQTTETIPGNTPGDASGSVFQWNTKDFNEVQGGITGNVNLYAKSDVYQTLPLYNNLKTRGNYVYGTNYDIDNNSCTINVEAEVRNESGSDKNITLDVAVVDADGLLQYTATAASNVPAATDAGEVNTTVVPADAYETDPAPTNADTMDVTYIHASVDAENVKFWSDEYPNLYDVYCIIKEGDTVLDVQKITTGFRQVDYDTTNGLQINGEKVYLKGYAQRSTNEWAVIGVANDWLTDIDMQLVKESNANFIRWMHVAPKPNAIRSGDKYGVISVAPAGDKEADATGRQWDQRMEAMRDTIIYFRNSPSVVLWEAGNNLVSAEHMQEMTDMKNLLDPTGERYMGTRMATTTTATVEQVNAAEWLGSIVNRRASQVQSVFEQAGRYLPIVETEYARDEAPRRVWDDYSPPDYDYVNKWMGEGASKSDGYDVWDLTSEDFAVSDVNQYAEFWNDRVGGSTMHNYYSGAAIMVWSDSNMHCRNSGSENCRTSGKVDAVRIKKEAFYALQTVQAEGEESAVNIIGHWNYPEYIEGDKENGNYWYEDKSWNGTYWQPNGTMLQRDPTKKTVYVVATTDCARMDLVINGEVQASKQTRDSTFLFSFPNIDVTQSGQIEAVGYNARGEEIARDIIKTAGEAATIRLTPVTGPNGLTADGSDIMYFDVEVVDEEGNVCPLNYDRINLSLEGEGVLLGGYNSGLAGEESVIGKDYVYAECGVNRVFVRSTRNAGDITITATIDGMLPVEYKITSNAIEVDGGLTTQPQASYAQGEVPEKPVVTVDKMSPFISPTLLSWGENTTVIDEGGEEEPYTVRVNGTEIALSQEPEMILDSLVGEIAPILDALKAAGADVSYEFLTEVPEYVDGRLPILEMTAGDTVVTASSGSTNLFLNRDRTDTNLLTGGIGATADGNGIVCDIGPMVSYIDGVEYTIDTEARVMDITFTV